MLLALATALSANRCTCAKSATSTVEVEIASNRARLSAASRNRSSEMSQRYRPYPSSAKEVATARPMPPAAPVIAIARLAKSVVVDVAPLVREWLEGILSPSTEPSLAYTQH